MSTSCRPMDPPRWAIVGAVALLGFGWGVSAYASDFGAPPDRVIVPAPSAAGPGGVPDDEPGNNMNERADTAAQANRNSMSDGDRQVMKAIRDGVKRRPPAAAPRKPKRSEKPLEADRP